MDVKEVIGERKPKDDSEGLRMVKAAIKVIFSYLFQICLSQHSYLTLSP